jgi:hypothetical protein
MYKGHQIIAINYANEKFRTQQKYNTFTAYMLGKVDKVIEYSIKDIDDGYLQRNATIFSYKRGAGLWVWKPYIVLHTLESMNEGDYLFYCDSGAFYVNKVSKVIDVMERENVSILPFELSLVARQWTKKETFDIIGYENYTHNQIITTCFLLKKCSYSIEVIKEWSKYNQDEKCASYDHFTNAIEFGDYIAHREDQSIFDIICRKNNVIAFRDPSQYGDRPWEYARSGGITVIKKYPSSTYPRIIISNRKMHPLKFLLREVVKMIALEFGLWSQKKYLERHKIPAELIKYE